MDPGRVLTVLLAGGRGQRLDPLTRDRAKPAVPFGAAYRIIDFTLSNCVNSGLTKVLTLVQYRSRSLNEHIRTAWSRFFNNTRGEFIEALPPQHHLGDSWYGGTATAVYQNLFALKDEHPNLIVVLSGDHIYKMDYRDLLKAHAETGAEATVCAVEVPKQKASAFGVLHVDEKNAIQAFVEKPQDPPTVPGKPDACLASMGVYVFNFKTLEKVLEEDTADAKSSHDFGRDIIPRYLGKKKLFAFPFIDKNTKKNQYWRDVGTIDAYYEANMDLVYVVPQLDLYDASWPIHHHAKMAPPPKFVFNEHGDQGRRGYAVDSMVSPGCILSGGMARNSILSPHVRIHQHAVVEESILMEDISVGAGAKIKRAIIDKHVRVPPGMTIGHDLEADRKRFTVTDSGIVVIPKGAVL